MNSERRRKLGLQKQARGYQSRISQNPKQLEYYKTNVDPNTGLDTYDVQGDNFTMSDSPNDIKDRGQVLETYDVNPDESISSQGLMSATSGSMPSEAMGGNEEATAAGKFFGFIRNKYDDFTQDLRARSKAKEEAYQGFMAEKPNIMNQYKDNLQQKMRDSYVSGLNQQLNAKPGDEWVKAYTQLGSGLSSISKLIPSTRDPSYVFGMSGSIFGRFPTGMQQQQPMQSMMSGQVQNAGPMINQAQMSQIQSRNLMPQMPEQYMDPSVVGSQVPKYSAAPHGSDPNRVYARVIKIDKFGKKRSFLRKMRVPEQMQQSMSMPNMAMRNVTPQQSRVMYNPQNMQQQLPNNYGMGGFRQGMMIDEGLGGGFDVGRFSGFTQAPNVDTARLANKSSMMSFNPEIGERSTMNPDRIVDFVKRRNSRF